MAISSISFAKSSSGSFAHNDRTEKEPNYLLPVEHRLENECNRSAVETQKMFDDLFKNSKEKYQEVYGQKLQVKKENAHWEAVINLNKGHTIKDVERLVKAIEKETGFTAVQISVHRDEGRINEKTRHPIYNLHAHVNFFTLDQNTGRQLYRKSISNSERQHIRKEQGIPNDEAIPRHLTGVMDRAKLSRLQDITARELKMVRGEKGSKAVRLDQKQYRAVEKEKEKLLEKIEELQKENTELRYSFRDMQKQITALEGINAEQKKELHRLNTEINKTDNNSNKDVKIQELEKRLTTITETALEAQKELKTYQNTILDQSSVIERLKAQNVEKDQAVMKTAVEVGVFSSIYPTFRAELIAPKITIKIDADKAKEHAKYEVTIAEERSEKEDYAYKLSEIHHAYEHEPSTLQPILDRQQNELKHEAKPAYKTALQRRDESYHERLGREPKKSYSGPKMRGLG